MRIVLQDLTRLSKEVIIHIRTKKGNTLITQEQLPITKNPNMNDLHLEEVLIINRLDKAARGRDIQATSQILKELEAQTSKHFAYEEELMEEAAYPEYQAHKSEHDRHLGELRHLVKHFDTHHDTQAIFVYIEGYLAPWFIHHTETMDKAMAESMV